MVPTIPADPLQPWPDVHNDRRRWLCTISQLHACQGLILWDNMLNAWQNGPWMELFMNLEIETSQFCLVFYRRYLWQLLSSLIHPKHRYSSGTVSTTSLKSPSLHRSNPHKKNQPTKFATTTPPLAVLPNFHAARLPETANRICETFSVKHVCSSSVDWLPVNRCEQEKDGESWLVGRYLP